VEEGVTGQLWATSEGHGSLENLRGKDIGVREETHTHTNETTSDGQDAHIESNQGGKLG